MLRPLNTQKEEANTTITFLYTMLKYKFKSNATQIVDEKLDLMVRDVIYKIPLVQI